MKTALLWFVLIVLSVAINLYASWALIGWIVIVMILLNIDRNVGAILAATKERS